MEWSPPLRVGKVEHLIASDAQLVRGPRMSNKGVKIGRGLMEVEQGGGLRFLRLQAGPMSLAAGARSPLWLALAIAEASCVARVSEAMSNGKASTKRVLRFPLVETEVAGVAFLPAAIQPTGVSRRACQDSKR
mmetsp:Transcript_36208/g.94174  ORF Transcript_36208/g.94174 Transcript_36208/m.94174 type:complete len:133 (+) Transcript_36208:597-995(+)